MRVQEMMSTEVVQSKPIRRRRRLVFKIGEKDRRDARRATSCLPSMEIDP
jgi:hypothetical protein